MKCHRDANLAIIDMANSPTLRQLVRVCNADLVPIDERSMFILASLSLKHTLYFLGSVGKVSNQDN